MVAVLEGADVTMTHCSYEMRAARETDVTRSVLGPTFPLPAALACMVVDGQGSSVYVEGTTIAGGDGGIQVQGGGYLAARGLRAMDIHKHAIFVQGAGSVAKLTSCILDSFPGGEMSSDLKELLGVPDDEELVPRTFVSARDLKVLMMAIRSVGVRVTEGAHAELSEVTGSKFDCWFMATKCGDIIAHNCRTHIVNAHCERTL